MIREMTAQELEDDCPTFVALKSGDMKNTKEVLKERFKRVEEDEQKEYLRVYDAKNPEEVVKYLYDNKIIVNEIWVDKIGLEEYYINLMNEKEAN